MYIKAIFQPNKAQSIVTATSFIIGDAMRNENVVPKGTPAPINPIKTGTAEHEQKGVAIPRTAAATLPINPLAFPCSPKSFLVLSGGKKLLMIDTTNVIAIIIKNITIVSVKKNSTESLKRAEPKNSGFWPNKPKIHLSNVVSKLYKKFDI
jgi:hypothetical protein